MSPEPPGSSLLASRCRGCSVTLLLTLVTLQSSCYDFLAVSWPWDGEEPALPLQHHRVLSFAFLTKAFAALTLPSFIANNESSAKALFTFSCVQRLLILMQSSLCCCFLFDWQVFSCSDGVGWGFLAAGRDRVKFLFFFFFGKNLHSMIVQFVLVNVLSSWL